jgi:hypothetical protein
LMAGVSEHVAAIAGKLMLDILARLNISRCALCGQAEHLNVWRSIPHTVAGSVWTCIRRISAPHATHFITPPNTTRGHGMHRPAMVSSGSWRLSRDVAAGPQTATRPCGTCGHSDEMRAGSARMNDVLVRFLTV